MRDGHSWREPSLHAGRPQPSTQRYRRVLETNLSAAFISAYAVKCKLFILDFQHRRRPLLSCGRATKRRGSTPPRSSATSRSEMVAPSPTCRKVMPEVRVPVPRRSRLRNHVIHVECQMSCSGSRQRLPNYGTSAIITDQPRLLPNGACDTVLCECRPCSARRRRVR